jgi:hypothetical protein
MRTVTFWLSLVLIFVMPWENIIEIRSLGTLAKGTGLLMMVFWAATVLVTGGFRKPRPFHLVVFLSVLWNAVSILWSVNVDRTVGHLLTYFQIFGLVLILWELYTTPAALKAGLQAYVLGGYVSIGSLMANYTADIKAVSQRYSATVFNANDLGLILALGLPVA